MKENVFTQRRNGANVQSNVTFPGFCTLRLCVRIFGALVQTS
jgi:hypothetical protein